MTGTISPESLQKYELWKQATSDTSGEPSERGPADDQAEQPLEEPE